MEPNPAVTFARPGQLQWFDPVLLTPSTLLQASRSPVLRQSTIATLKQLTPDDYVEFVIGYLERGDSVFGDAWDYTDLLLTLGAAARLLCPATYLEIGVRRGRSMAMVARHAPDADVWGLDLWIQNYAGLENPGPEFVRQEMQRLGHTGALTLVTGDSRETLPALFAERPDLYFDIVTVDGDHSAEGAAADLTAVMPRVRPGGVVLFDDIAHPQHLYLADCWRETVGANPAFQTGSFTDLGYGIAIGIRKGQG